MSRKHLSLGDVLRVGVVVGALMGAFVVPGTAMAAHRSAHDLDGDGLSNRYERLHTHTNPRRADTNHNGIKDGNENPDHDGLTNRQEKVVGTNPLKSDTDGDGIKDGKDDQDHDGLDNKDEIKSGTDPRDADTDNDGVEDSNEDSDRRRRRQRGRAERRDEPGRCRHRQ